jgi:hypothetical protein
VNTPAGVVKRLHEAAIKTLEHPDVHVMFLSGKKAPRKVSGVIPHDIGSPQEDPWRQVNAYLAQDVSRWKDLNSKAKHTSKDTYVLVNAIHSFRNRSINYRRANYSN